VRHVSKDCVVGGVAISLTWPSVQENNQTIPFVLDDVGALLPRDLVHNESFDEFSRLPVNDEVLERLLVPSNVLDLIHFEVNCARSERSQGSIIKK